MFVCSLLTLPLLFQTAVFDEAAKRRQRDRAAANVELSRKCDYVKGQKDKNAIALIVSVCVV